MGCRVVGTGGGERTGAWFYVDNCYKHSPQNYQKIVLRLGMVRFMAEKTEAVMKWIIPAILLAYAIVNPSHVQSQENKLDTAEGLASACRLYVQLTDNQLRGVNTSDYVSAGFCGGYLNGFAANGSYAELFTDASQLYCVPKGVNIAQSIKVFLKYTDDHPEELHLPAGMVLVHALRKAFPCPN